MERVVERAHLLAALRHGYPWQPWGRRRSRELRRRGNPPGVGLDHGPVRPGALAHQPSPGPGTRPPWPLLRRPGSATPPARLPALTEATEPPET